MKCIVLKKWICEATSGSYN